MYTHDNSHLADPAEEILIRDERSFVPLGAVPVLDAAPLDLADTHD